MGSRRASEREAMSLRETALVTGCGSAEGIGFAAARLLARLGASVAITSTTAERLEARATELQRDGARVFRRVADLTDRGQAGRRGRHSRSSLAAVRSRPRDLVSRP